MLYDESLVDKHDFMFIQQIKFILETRKIVPLLNFLSPDYSLGTRRNQNLLDYLFSTNLTINH